MDRDYPDPIQAGDELTVSMKSCRCGRWDPGRFEK
jgi:hypothetical protein